jgi:hypothetical protein
MTKLLKRSNIVITMNNLHPSNPEFFIFDRTIIKIIHIHVLSHLTLQSLQNIYNEQGEYNLRLFGQKLNF